MLKDSVQLVLPPVRPARARGLVTTARVALYAAPFALAGFAGAEGLDTLTTQATSGVGTLTTAVGTIAGVALTIGLIIWGVSKLKPRG